MLLRISLLACIATGLGVAAPSTLQDRPPAPSAQARPGEVRRLRQQLVEFEKALEVKQRAENQLDQGVERESKGRSDALHGSIAEHEASYQKWRQRVEDAAAEAAAAEALVERLKAEGLMPSHSKYRVAQDRLRRAKMQKVLSLARANSHGGALTTARALLAAVEGQVAIQAPSEGTQEGLQRLKAEIFSLEQRLENSQQVLRLQLQREELEAKLASSQSKLNAFIEKTKKLRHEVVLDDFLGARAAAAASGLPLLVNFTGHTAINARVMEVKVFALPEVAPLLSRFVEARLHFDASDSSLREDVARRMAEFDGTAGTPAYIAMDPRSGEELGRFSGLDADGDRFAEFLKKTASRMEDAGAPATDRQLWRQIFALEDRVNALAARAESRPESGGR